eukprot:4468136-Prymnesium_polylepis.1
MLNGVTTSGYVRTRQMERGTPTSSMARFGLRHAAAAHTACVASHSTGPHDRHRGNRAHARARSACAVAAWRSLGRDDGTGGEVDTLAHQITAVCAVGSRAERRQWA